MKKIILIFLWVLIPIKTQANSAVVNVYNWANSMDPAVLNAFTKKTGIVVHYQTFDSNETLYAKLKTDPNIGYDVIMPSSYYIKRMIRDHLIRSIDLKQVPHWHLLNKALLAQPYDRHNTYSLPFLWGATGIVYNDQYYSRKKINDWSDLWQKHFKNQVLMLDDMRDTFSVALITLGYNINDTDPQHIRQAYLALNQLWPNIKLFSTDGVIGTFIDEDATVGMIWNTDAYIAKQENSHLHFVYPKSHYALWMDCVAIAKNAPHYQNALRFINFINRPDMAEKISMASGELSPNVITQKRMQKKLTKHPLPYPDANTLKRGVMENGVGDALGVYAYYWQRLKLGGN